MPSQSQGGGWWGRVLPTSFGSGSNNGAAAGLQTGKNQSHIKLKVICLPKHPGLVERLGRGGSKCETHAKWQWQTNQLSVTDARWQEPFKCFA